MLSRKFKNPFQRRARRHASNPITADASTAHNAGVTAVADTNTVTTISSPDDEKIGPLGLSLLHSPALEPTIDFVFVHGLGGGSRKTWSKTGSPDHFWPKQWLPLEPEFQRVRVHSYGYNVNWTKPTADIWNVHDFGKGLLAELSTSPALSTTATRMVLVGHSMGGLVIKQAYILARQDATYRSIADRIHTMYFLATPHRGSDSARLLKNILRVVGLSHDYIGDLSPGSLSNQTINDTFRHCSNDVCLWSFYETRETSLGTISSSSALIVDRQSALIGLPAEKQIPMDADHRSICKFESREDPGYKLLRNSFANTVSDIEKLLVQARDKEQRGRLRALKTYLHVSDTPEDDLDAIRDVKEPGTCGWLTSSEGFASWESSSSDGPAVFWLRGQPGGGKSVLAGHVVDHLLRKTPRRCSFYFFKRGDKSKARLSSCLRSLAFQMASVDPGIQARLLQMHDEDVDINSDDVRSLWRKLFESGILSTASSSRQYYWVLDALDECTTTGPALTFFLAKLEEQTCLKVFITSREPNQMEQHMRYLHTRNGRTMCRTLEGSDTLADMKTLIHSKMVKWAARDEQARLALEARVLKASEGCFLWSVLVLDKMRSAHGKADILRLFDSVPREMGPLYQEILNTMSQTSEKQALAKAILMWSACAFRPLTIAELTGALHLQADTKDEFISLRESIGALCGQLVRVDKNDVVYMVHETAREFLLHGDVGPMFAFKSTDAHTRLASACLAALVSNEMEPPRANRQTKQATTSRRSPFTGYACEAFSDHLALSDPHDTHLWHLIQEFLKANVLSWIEAVAEKRDLRPLTRAAKNLERYLLAASAMDQPSLDEEQNTARSWATDLMRITAEFGKALMAYPSAIHWIVLPFCPTESAAYKTAISGQRFSVTGNLRTHWDELVARIDLRAPSGRGYPTGVCHGGDLFAISFSDGWITLYHADSCQEYRVFHHPGGCVDYMAFNAQTELLASLGETTLCIWNVTTGAQILNFEPTHRLMALTFDGEVLLAPNFGGYMESWDVANHDNVSRLPNRPWDNSANGNAAGAKSVPCAVAVSDVLKLLAVVYDDNSISLWDLDTDSYRGGGELESFSKVQDFEIARVVIAKLLFNDNKDTPLLAVSYGDGELLTKELFNGEIITRSWLSRAGYGVTASPDGHLLAGFHQNPHRIDIYEFETLSVFYRIQLDKNIYSSLAFSRGNRRVLGIGRSTIAVCNVWEPAISLKRSSVDTWTTIAPTRPGAPEVGLLNDFVICSTMHPGGEFLVLGTANGSVLLHDLKDGREARTLHNFGTRFSVVSLGWQDERRALICVGFDNVVTVWRLKQSPVDGWDVEELLFQTQLNINRHDDIPATVYVSQASARFVVSFLEKSRDGRDIEHHWNSHIWNIDTQRAEAWIRRTGPFRGTMPWIDHPHSQGHMLCVQWPVVRTFACSGWSETRTVTLPISAPRPLSPALFYPCLGGRKLLVTTRSGLPSLFTIDNIDLFESSPFRLPDEINGAPRKSLHSVSVQTYADLMDKVDRIIGVGGDRLIFVDRDFWVCSADLQELSAAYLRHFMIPGDWSRQHELVEWVSAERAGRMDIVAFKRRCGAILVVRNALEFAVRVDPAAEDEEPPPAQSELSLGG